MLRTPHVNEARAARGAPPRLRCGLRPNAFQIRCSCVTRFHFRSLRYLLFYFFTSALSLTLSLFTHSFIHSLTPSHSASTQLLGSSSRLPSSLNPLSSGGGMAAAAGLPYDVLKKSRDVRSLEKDLQYSRSPFATWGKQVVFAIDRDHGGRLIHTFRSKKHLGADIDAQTGKAGYGGYSWTLYIHNFLGRCLLSRALAGWLPVGVVD